MNANVTHGENRVGKRTKEYTAWNGIKCRCLRPNTRMFPHYGGRGIKMHPAWQNDYPTFLAYVGRAPSRAHSLDRIDNNGNYEPGNVRWATEHEQKRNTSRNIIVDGLCLKDYCEREGISYSATLTRLRKGDPVHLAVSPLKHGDYRKLRLLETTS